VWWNSVDTLVVCYRMLVTRNCCLAVKGNLCEPHCVNAKDIRVVFKWFIPVVCENIIMNINDIRYGQGL